MNRRAFVTLVLTASLVAVAATAFVAHTVHQLSPSIKSTARTQLTPIVPAPLATPFEFVQELGAAVESRLDAAEQTSVHQMALVKGMLVEERMKSIPTEEYEEPRS